ncbi:hypothetical protein CAR_c04460 [Carnobacterium sp. 17-4]|uniref:hypothetical protein n=1 Tax=Carnobacterium sp. (strain 17-4) TaxID=208596 RepID=UPI000205912D|nr:hypothetical protein [Carnobacterium sp. 17-4]AEB29166.1 hypothetical protein CAR_c04460 [Carnobacterium sp. 17-4]
MNINIIKENFFKCLPEQKIKIVEDQLKNNNFKMTLELLLSKEGEPSNIYQLFELKDEHSKIKFLHYNEFPDGVFIKKISEKEYKIFIIEMKRDITKYLDKIPKQLHSGILHAISIIKMTESRIMVENKEIVDIHDIKLTYELFICSGKKITYSTPKKVIPGKPVYNDNRLQLLINSNQVYHKLKGKDLVELPVKIVVFNHNIGENGSELYTGSIDLS